MARIAPVVSARIAAAAASAAVPLTALVVLRCRLATIDSTAEGRAEDTRAESDSRCSFKLSSDQHGTKKRRQQNTTYHD